MLKMIAAGLFAIAGSNAAFAACSMEDAMTKTTDLATVLAAKAQSKPEAAAKLSTDIATIMSTGEVTDDTCKKLDAAIAAAKKL